MVPTSVVVYLAKFCEIFEIILPLSSIPPIITVDQIANQEKPFVDGQLLEVLGKRWAKPPKVIIGREDRTRSESRTTQKQKQLADIRG